MTETEILVDTLKMTSVTEIMFVVALITYFVYSRRASRYNQHNSLIRTSCVRSVNHFFAAGIRQLQKRQAVAAMRRRHRRNRLDISHLI